MTTRLTHDLTYPAPLDEVATMLRDPAFRQQVCERQHVLSYDVRVEDRPGGPADATRVTVSQVQRVRKVPAFAAKLVGEQIEITQQEEWRSRREGDVTITVPGVPVTVRGTVRLQELDTVTVETVDLTLKVALPLVGGKLEALLADLVTKALDAEAEVGRDYLAG